MLRLTKHINKPFTNISKKSSLKLLYGYNRSNITSITYASMRTLYVSNTLYKNKKEEDGLVRKIDELIKREENWRKSFLYTYFLEKIDTIGADKFQKILNKYKPLTTKKLQDIMIEYKSLSIKELQDIILEQSKIKFDKEEKEKEKAYMYIKNGIFQIDIEKELIIAAMKGEDMFMIELNNYGDCTYFDIYPREEERLLKEYNEFLRNKNLDLNISIYVQDYPDLSNFYFVIKW